MATRKEERERRRAERLEAERRRVAADRKRTIFGYSVAGVLTAAVIAGIVVVVLSGGGSNGSSGTYSPGNSVPPDAEVGVQTTAPPWQPEYAHLGQRLDALGLPGLNENIFHIHSLLHVYANGKNVTVPANIGIDTSSGTFSSLHTHDTSGLVHMEADRTYPFTIGQFFAVWGVKFSDDQLGPYRSKDNDQLSVYVNGKKVTDPVNYVMKEGDEISVGYGKQGSFPTNPPGAVPAGA
jgi:hypothetical protein